MDTSGNFVIAWSSESQDGSGYGIYAQRYNSNGLPVGSEFRVNTYTAGAQEDLSVVMDIDGNFVISWDSNGQDGSGWGVYAQRYDLNGMPVGTEFQVNTYIDNYQLYPSVAMDSNGNFVIAWASYQQDGSDYGVYAQRYDLNGTPLGSEFRVNTYTISAQYYTGVGMDAQGNFTVTWDSFGQDGNNWGIFAQRYGIIDTTPPVVTITNAEEIDGQITNGTVEVEWEAVDNIDGTWTGKDAYSAEGRYENITVTVKDKAGNSGTSTNSVSFIIDKTPPAILVEGLNDVDEYTESIQIYSGTVVTWTIYDPVSNGVSSGLSPDSDVSGFSSYIDLGMDSLGLTAIDNAGNIQTFDAEFEVIPSIVTIEVKPEAMNRKLGEGGVNSNANAQMTVFVSIPASWVDVSTIILNGATPIKSMADDTGNLILKFYRHDVNIPLDGLFEITGNFVNAPEVISLPNGIFIGSDMIKKTVH